MIFFPLAASDCLPFLRGKWVCESQFSKAINLRSSSNQLFTLHRYGHGLSPMGWIISGADFDLLSTYLKPGTRLIAADDCLQTSHIRLFRPRRTLCLRLPQGMRIAPHALDKYIEHRANLTGLCGPLNQAQNVASPYNDIFCQQLSHWAQGMVPDWRSIIGLGPGLTPSGDDMLIGAMAVLYATELNITHSQMTDFIPEVMVLSELTTSVSASYLGYAQRGYFSTPVHTLLRRLTRGSLAIDCALESLIRHGHTSGADTVLGMSFALHWQNSQQRGS